MRTLRLSIRSLLKSPGFTAIALLTLALGIGVNTAMFSLLDTLLFKAAPYPDAKQLVRIFRTSQQSQAWPHSPPELADLRAGASGLEKMTWFFWSNFSFAEPGQPAERIPGLSVGPDFFATLRVQPALGRDFTAAESTPGQNGVILLSHGLWQRRFAGDPGVVGRTIRVDGENVTVIGVMPDGVEYPMLWGRIEAWRPAAFTAEQLKDRGRHWISALGRLKPGTTLRAAQSEFTAIAARWVRDFPDVSTGTSLRLVELHRSTMDQTGQRVSGLVMGLSGFVLLIACANLANLQLARTGARSRELAIRSALGASRRRIMAELLLESLVLSLAGGLLGLLLANWITAALGRHITMGEVVGLPIELDLSVLLFALVVSIATGVLFGLLPAWTASRLDVNTVLKQQARGSTGDRSQHRLRHALIVGEVALALALLSSAGFFVRGLQRFTSQDTGWDREHVLIATVTLPESAYGTPEKKRAFYERALERLQGLPGVEKASLSSSLPVWSYNSSRDVVPEGQPLPPLDRTPLSYVVSVSPDYFAVLKIGLVQGRLFDRSVRGDGPAVAVINETMARQFWPGENPIGKRIGSSDPDNQDWQEVIGVVRDVGFLGNLSNPETRLQAYRPLAQDPWNYLSIAVRTSGPAPTLASGVRQAIAAIDPDLPAYNVRTVDQAVGRLAHNFELTNQLLIGFAGLGLLLAAIGLYGVIAGLVVQRTSEFGIRLALGAQTSDVLWLVLGKGLRLATLGTMLGLVGSSALIRVFSALLPALPGQDYLVLSATVLALLLVSLLACWLPARRATRVDPITALRAE